MSLQVLPPHWRLQPFERELAALEASSLASAPFAWQGDILTTAADIPAATTGKIRRRLGLGRAVVTGSGEHATVQHLLEKSAGGGRRKVTSHALHGLHAYKGKFYPQLARAAINAAGVPAGGKVLDPFAGCGTSVLEAALLGLHGYGVDANPLAVLVSEAKLAMLSYEPDQLNDALDPLRKPPAHGIGVGDPEYLSDWLPADNYRFLGRLLNGVNSMSSEQVRQIALVIISSVLRDGSRQDPKQLRVGRRAASDDIPDLRELVEAALDSALENLAAARSVADIDWDNIRSPERHVTIGDARKVNESLPKDVRGKFDAVVTSPPYANALPYIDTDRLSLRAFGMLNGGGQRAAEQKLIGNREINTSVSASLNAEVEEILAGSNGVPSQLRIVLAATSEAAKEDSAGFRRKRTPGLLLSYFRDMDSVFANTAALLKPERPAVVVVGDSTVTGPRGSSLPIPTTDILIELAARHGLEVSHDLGKRLTSYGASTTVHQRNAMDSERVVIFTRSAN
jgi:site-specific DNA-methyltransferase (cytosine-N4-specific)